MMYIYDLRSSFMPNIVNLSRVTTASTSNGVQSVA